MDSNNRQRADERLGREAARRAKGQVRAGSGKGLAPRSLNQMVSLRLDPRLVSELRTIALERKMSLSAVLREAAALYAEESRKVVEINISVKAGETSLEEAHRSRWSTEMTSEGTLREASG